MNLRKCVKLICMVLALMIITASSALAVNTSSFVDFPDDWSTPAMEYAVENGLIKGYEDNTIRAEQNITRAEMATIVNRAFGAFVEATSFPYLDVEDIDWYYSDMKKAVNMGTMQGDGSKYLRPDDDITREEAFVVIARAYSQKDSDFSPLDQYPDKEDINDWSKDYLSFLTRNDYVNGFDDGNLYPQANLTRAELSQLLFNMLDEYLNSQEALDAKDTYTGNVVINGGIAEITGKTFKGDLVIGDGVGTNKIVIKDTKIAGALVVRGTTQIKIIDSSVGNRIIVNNPNNNVHFDNYKAEKVFNNVETQTSATWKTAVAGGGGGGGGTGGGSSGGGGTTYYTVTYYVNNTFWAKESVSSGSLATEKTYFDKPGYTLNSSWYTTSGMSQLYDFTTPVTGNLNLYATASANKYTITFDADGGTVGTAEKEVTYDSTYGTLPTPEKTGYTFEGWFIGNTEIDENSQVKITTDTELTAKWKANTYKVEYNANGGKGEMAPSDHTYDVPAALSKNQFTKEERKFAGWAITEPATIVKYTDEEVVENLTTEPGGVVKLYAVWVLEDSYNVTIKDPTGAEADKIIPVEANKALGDTYEPTKTGHTYEYYTDAATTQKYDPTKPVTGDITIYIKWNPNSYKITWVNDDGTVLETDDAVEYGTVPTYDGATPTKAPTAEFTYTFSGWTPAVVAVTGEATYKATYTETLNSYTITFKNYDGSVLEEKTLNFGEIITYTGVTPEKPADAQYTYTFSGWDNVLGTVSGPAEYEAQYTETLNSYTITFKNYDGSVLEEKTLDFGETITYTGVTPEKPADAQYTYTFSGWSPALGTVSGPAEYEAQYAEALNSYTITFKNYDGSILETKTLAFGETITYTGVTPEKPADAQFTYTFSGWDNALGTVSGPAEYEAQYTETLNSYIITFKNYDGSVLEEKTLAFGETITYTGVTPEKPADAQYTYTFSGWSPVLGTVTGEATFEAQFNSIAKKHTYTVKYEGNGAEYGTKPDDTEHIYNNDEREYLAENTFTKVGNTFLGWSTDKDAEVATYKKEDLSNGFEKLNLTTVPYGEVTLYAIWEPYTYTVEYKGNGATEGSMSPSEHKYGKGPALTENKFKKKGYTFVEWSKLATALPGDPYNITDKYSESKLTAIDNDRVTLYAVWEANEYKIVYNGNDNTSGETLASTHNYDENVTLTENGFKKTGYNFMGWDTDPSGENVVYEDKKTGLSNLTAEPDGVINLYAVWKPITYTIKFVDDFDESLLEDGDTICAEYPQTFVYDEEKELMPSKHKHTGYHVLGWTDDVGGIKAEFLNPDHVNTENAEDVAKTKVKNLTDEDGAVITFYTVWQNNNYFVSYDGDETKVDAEGNIDMEPSEHKYNEKSKLSKNTYKKVGYDTFVGWNLVPKQSTFSTRSRLFMAEPTISAKYQDENEILNLTEILGDTVEMIAVWQPNKYYVQYDKNDNEAMGSMSNSTHTYDEEKALTTKNFTKTGYGFTGWAETATGAAKYKDGEAVKNLTSKNGETVVLYATWEEIEYTIVFDGNGATEGVMTDVGPIKYSDVRELQISDNKFKRNGYTFKGWAKSASAQTPDFTYDEDGICKVSKASDVAGNITFYAVWEPNTYKLTFDVNGGNALELTSELEALGYYKDTETGEITVEVTYDGTYPKLPTATWPEESEEPMYFAGWELNGNDMPEDNIVKIETDTKLKAKWTDELVHKVIFNNYNEDGTAYTTTVINKTAITEPQDPTKTGYEFDFWSLEEENGTAYDFDTIVQATSVQTINLYPYFHPITYYVSYDGNDATEGTMSNSTHTYDELSQLTLNAYKKDNHTFMGWDTDPAGETVVYENGADAYNLADEQDEIVTLYAVWAEDAYTVIYDGNGATEGSMTPSTHYINTPKELTKNSFKKANHKFLGWSEDKDATVPTYTDEQEVTNLTQEDEITLYAIWEAETYKLTFDVNGGNALELTSELEALGYYEDTETGKITVNVTYNGEYPQFPVATYPEGEMSFGGWSINSNIVASGDTVDITEDTELVAVWTNKHIVVFHGYYNDGVDSLTTYVEDGQSAVKPEDPVHSQFTFGGWYTDEACTDGNEYDFATVINKVNDEYQTIHLYPKWLITVTFYYGPEAVDSEKVAEVAVAYNTAVPETDIPTERKETGYWKDSSVSSVYEGEEYEHEIEFLWYELIDGEFVLFDETQLITESKDVFNLSKYVSIYVESSKDAIDGAAVSAYYTEEEAIYEAILDVIFLYDNVAGTVYDEIQQKEKVFDILIEKGIIDENHNILNQAVFLKFSLMGEERLEKFVYENVENELTIDAKESISSYLNHLIEKNDGSAEEFLKELIDSLLNGEGKEEMKGVLSDMLTEMVDLEKDEFIKYVNKYIDDSIAEGNTQKVEDLIHPQIEKLLTEAIAKDFVREMSKEQLTNFVNIYADTLTETELKAEVKDYIEGLDESEIEAEVVEYVNSLSGTEIKSEITTYINSLTPEQLNGEITAYVNDMEADELSDAIVEYINTLSGEALKAEIKTYINGLDDTAKEYEVRQYINGLTETERAVEIASYVNNLSPAEFQTEINSYISGLGDDDFEEELEKYLEENDEEYENLIREHLGLASDVVITDQDKIDHLEDVIDYVMTEPGKKDEVTDKASEHIATSKKTEYEAEIISKVTSNFDSYKDSIVNKAVTSDLDNYIGKAVDKIVAGANLNSYISDTAYSLATGQNKVAYAEKAINTIISDSTLKATYTAKTIDNIVGGNKKSEYVTKAVKRILGGSDRDTYINDTIDKIFADGEEQTYIDKAVAEIVGKTPADYSEIDEYIEKMFATSEKKAKVVNYINEQFIANKDFREAILPDAIDMIFANEDSKTEVVSTIVDFVLNDEEALADVTEIAIEDLVEDAEFREHTIDKIADYLEHHPDIMEEVVEFAKESELGVFVDEFIEELMNKNQFRVHPDNLFVAEAIERALAHYDYDSFMNEYIPERFAGLIPDSILKPIYDNALNGFKSQLQSAIAEAKLGNTAYVDSGVTVEFNPMADVIIPVFDKYLEFKDKAEDKLEGNDGKPGDAYEIFYDENKYVKALVDLIKIENFLNGDSSQATETLSGYSLKDFDEYYDIVRNASALLSDAGKWYVDNLPQDKAEEAQEILARKVTEYFNSILALVNTYSETKELPSYKDVLEIFEGDIPDRFFDKYESALSKIESKVDVDDKLEDVYNKLAEKGIVSKFNTVIDKFVASKFNREISEEQVPMIYTIVRRTLGYDDFYTVDTVFDVMNEKLTRFKVDEDTFVIGNNKLKVTIEREYR